MKPISGKSKAKAKSNLDPKTVRILNDGELKKVRGSGSGDGKNVPDNPH